MQVRGVCIFYNSLNNIKTTAESDPIDQIIEGWGNYFGASKNYIDFNKMMAAGAMMGLAASTNTALKRVVYTISVAYCAKAGYEFGKGGFEMFK